MPARALRIMPARALRVWAARAAAVAAALGGEREIYIYAVVKNAGNRTLRQLWRGRAEKKMKAGAPHARA